MLLTVYNSKWAYFVKIAGQGMRYRTDIKTGNSISALGYGCMRFPKIPGAAGMRKIEELIVRSVNGGVNYFDTAFIYPGSEDALGAVLEKNGLRKKVFIATKLPVVILRGPGDFDRYFGMSLKRLRTDYADYYLMHMLTNLELWNKLVSWGITDWIVRKKKSGEIRSAGFSFHGSSPEFQKILDGYDWDMTQIQYNYSDENFQAGTAGLKAAAKKMPVVIMEPLLGGKLAALSPEAEGLFRKADPSLSPAGRGLNWVWNREEVTTLLSGMSTMGQLEENLALADRAEPGMLGKEDLDLYRRVLEVVNRGFKIRCTGCNYCMPCPCGVNIPSSFAAYNLSYSMGYIEGMKHFVTSTAVISEKTGSPGLCVRCGRCEQHCPQHLPVIEYLAMVRRRMEPLWFRLFVFAVRAILGKNHKAAAL
jgi:predicted aldo/keto reductase-like oxidoreductase